MRHTLLVMALVAPFAPAAPPPKGEPARMEKLFGTPVDPDKDCTFKLDRKKLVITVPDKAHPVATQAGKLATAPRVLREVTGDFVARVKVVCRLPQVARAKVGKSWEYAAGLIVEQNERRYVSIEITRFATTTTDGPLTQLHRRACWDGTAITTCTNDGKTDLEAETWLELARVGDRIHVATTHNSGQTWDSISDPVRHTLPQDIKVGLIAGHSGPAGFTATFEDFTVEPLDRGPTK